MNHNYVKLFCASAFISLLFGCSSTPYQVTSGAPHAYIENQVVGTVNRSDSIGISVKVDRDFLNLYYISRGSVHPEGPIAIDANKLLEFYYVEDTGGGYQCTVNVKALLEPDKYYAFIGGYKFTDSFIPFLPNRGCEFGIKDLENGQIISE